MNPHSDEVGQAVCPPQREEVSLKAALSALNTYDAVIARIQALTRGGSMATPCIAQVAFRFHGNSKPVVAAFDVAHASSDGGAVLLKAIDTQWGLTQRLAGCLEDPRQPGKVQHQGVELLRQRIFGLACGYAATATTRRGWRTTPSTSCWSGAIRSRARPSPPSPRCRDSRMRWARAS